MRVLFHMVYFCFPVQSCVPWTVAATVSAPEGYASVKRAGWDPPVKNGRATPTVLSTGSARMGSVSAALDGKGTTAPLVRGFCTSRNEIHKILHQSYTAIILIEICLEKQRLRIQTGVKKVPLHCVCPTE